MPTTSPKLEQIEQQAREYLAPRWERAGIEPPAYPCDTAAVIDFLDALEFIVDPKTVAYYVHSGKILSPPRANGRWQWHAMDICDLIAALDQRRQWKPLSTIHAGKKSRWQHHRELADAGTAPAVFSDLEKFDLDDLMLRLVECDHRETREMIYTAIQMRADQLRPELQKAVRQRVAAGN